MPRTAEPKFVQPREACTFDHEGEVIVLSPNEVMAADHPIARARPELFKPLEASRQRPDVEQMTAAPGEKRGTQPGS